jgi:hypothetical protein
MDRDWEGMKRMSHRHRCPRTDTTAAQWNGKMGSRIGGDPKADDIREWWRRGMKEGGQRRREEGKGGRGGGKRDERTRRREGRKATQNFFWVADRRVGEQQKG